MKRIAFYFLLLLCHLTIACDDLDEEVVPEKPEKLSSVVFNCQLPEDWTEGTLQNLELVIKDVNTGKAYHFTQDTIGSSIQAELKNGFYDASLNGEVCLLVGDDTLRQKVYGVQSAINVLGEPQEYEVSMFLPKKEQGFVLAEIFFSGTKNPQGRQYYADKYFVIYNNSDQTLYADSLAIAESRFQTVSKLEYTPDIMDEAMAVQALYMIPGDGHSHPVKPGESLLICDNALDHTRPNPNSFDLRSADFEWVDISTNPNFSDVNNPDVPDLEKIYCYTATMWSPHNRGFNSYALVKMGTDTEDYLANYAYYYDYLLVGAAGQMMMSGDCYRVPNSWIVDAVNLSVESLFSWLVVTPSLDRGWTHCGTHDFDESRYGKSVRRKVIGETSEGIAILKDTNNSTVDFDAEQTADPYHKFKFQGQ